MQLSHILNALGEEHQDYYNAIAPPIVQTSNFLFDTVAQMRKAFEAEYETYVYSRGINPTVDMLRQKLAALDGAEDALVFNSGASAIFCSVLPFVQAGAHIVSVQAPYTWAHKMFTRILPRFSVQTSFIDGTKVQNWQAAIQPNTRLFYLESPNSWTYEIQDLAAIAQLAKQQGIITVIDNSYCTPLYQQPLAHGIDLSLQSATKYIGGHSDCVAGVVSGSRALMERIFYSEYMTTGAGCTPFHAWLLLRGLRTLPMRLKWISQTTTQVISWLHHHPMVQQVLYPLEDSFAQAGLARQYLKGAGGLFTIVLKPCTAAGIEACCNALQRFKMAVSWGGHESLIIPRLATMPVAKYNPEQWLHRTLRLYVGLEEAAYLIADLEQAFKKLEPVV